jgi:GDP-4-dehydro-6-deoxy-D-mannose reductase
MQLNPAIDWMFTADPAKPARAQRPPRPGAARQDARRLVGILLFERGKSGEVYNLGGSSMSAVLSCVLQRATRNDIVPEIDPQLLRPTDEPVIWADCTKLRAMTGWEPEISLDQTIDDMLSYWRQKPDRALIV